MDKKGQVNIFGGNSILVVAFVTLGIAFLIAGILTLVNSEFASQLQSTTAYRVDNETGNGTLVQAYINDSIYFSAARSNRTFVSLANVRVYNNTAIAGQGTADAIIAAGNYTIDTAAGSIINATVLNYNNVSWTYDYTLNDNPDEFQIVKNGSGGIIKLSSFGQIMGIIIALAVIGALIALGIATYKTRRE